MTSDGVAVGEVDSDAVDRARTAAAEADRVVVKAGTNSLTDEESRLDRVKLDKLVADVMDLRRRGKEVVLVSSGAVGAGVGRLGNGEGVVDVDIDRGSDIIDERQALSTVGQSLLMRHYTQSFDRYDQPVAQILVTGADLDAPERFDNFTNTVETLLDWGVVPVVNENDAVATDELRIGDNDMLSASAAIALDVDLLVTLTDVDAVYTGHPKRDPEATAIEAVGTNYDAVRELIGDSTATDFGGIRTKVEGARDVAESGTPAVIAGSATPDVLDRIAAGKPTGTLFVPTAGETNE
ncbi:glutamate 5-kinase [Halorubrum sp. CBA1229]|jgi:glutamate 5-kinase|uniref:glutamate 5-kinase n=1 Tax=Halorubrum sp. CBA1229 TaxID=1853699 RepID=UPI000F41512E|nr:glutamate 5-kinase [Halorubrum sp. CBA1229]QKY18238.1 glutamate 5-kinase [Halorubrum sp. CBA1229]